MKSKLVKITLALALAVLAACKPARKSEPELLSLKTVPVKTIKLLSEDSVGLINATGLISTEDEAKCSFKIGGVIDHIYVKEGERFHKGKVLATLKLTEIESGLLQAQLGLDKARRDYQRTQNL